MHRSVLERPLIMDSAAVIATRAGTKTQTRMLLKDQPQPRGVGDYFDAYCSEIKTTLNPRGMSDEWCWWTADHRPAPSTMIRCPFGQPGGRLWVKEAWQTGLSLDDKAPILIESMAINAGHAKARAPINFVAGGNKRNADMLGDFGSHWGRIRSPQHLPRWAARITLEITEIRVQRLQEISEDDAKAEGCNKNEAAVVYQQGERAFNRELNWTARGAYAIHWDATNGKRALWASNPWVWAIGVRMIEGAA